MLQHEYILHLGSHELTGCLDSRLARGADGDGDERIFLKVGNGAERLPELAETLVAEVALEDALFNADAVAFAAFGNALQSARIADVVGDDAEHKLMQNAECRMIKGGRRRKGWRRFPRRQGKC